MEDLLKEFWPIVLFFIVAIFSYVRNDAKIKSRQPKRNHHQPELIMEEFPPVELTDMTHSQYTVAKKPRAAYKNKTANGFAKQNDGKCKQKSDVALVSEKKGVKSMLKNKSEMKKALVYSEIINRKYI